MNTKDIKNIVACGDVHGKFGELGYRIRERYRITDSLICLAGDIGLGFHKHNYYVHEWKELDKIAKKSNNMIVAVRGNHDDPEYFDGSFGPKLGFTNIMLVPDYTVIETDAGRVLFIGGATSIDRAHRAIGTSYWANEAPIYDKELLEAAGNPDVIVTHTAPSFCHPTTKDGIEGWIKKDPSLAEDIDNERRVFDEVWNYLHKNDRIPSVWVYGHFHTSRIMTEFGVKFKVMDELEFYQIDI